MISEKSQYTLRYGDVLKAAGSGTSHDRRLWPFSVPSLDPEGWRISIEDPRVTGRLMWRYLATDQERQDFPQTPGAKYYVGLPIEDGPDMPSSTRPMQAALNGAGFHSRLQTTEGSWGTDMSCIYFVTPMLVITWYIVGAQMPEAHAMAIVNYAFAIQNEDGGWPTFNYSSQSTDLMGTLLMYVALRLMGFGAEHERLLKARKRLLAMGGALYLPMWGKFWLCLLGLYDWKGSDPYPAEMWMLPRWVPVSPWNWFCIPRQAAMGMSYLWSVKFKIPANPLLDEIREEIFTDSMSSIDLTLTRGIVMVAERHQPKPWLLRLINWLVEFVWIAYLRTETFRQRSVQNVLDLTRCEDSSTNSNGLISIDHFLNTLTIFSAEGPDSKNTLRMLENCLNYLWMNPGGLQAASIYASEPWEASFVLQAMVSAGMADKPELRGTMQRTYDYMVRQQYLDDWQDSPPALRFSRIGGWPFMSKNSGYACSDCTGEALKAVLMARTQTDLDEPPVSDMDARIRLGVDNLLMNQNPTGGYSSFEPRRCREYIELLNGTELFGDVMVEYDYVECAASALTALTLFRSVENYRAKDIERCINRGVDFIHKQQRADGSWAACWGIGFTYGAKFALEALGETGETYQNSQVARRGCEFLLRKQREDGGWGETTDSVFLKHKVYTQAVESHTTQTAWACLALMYARCPNQEPIKKGIRLIMSRQKANGQWPQEEAVGCGILTCQLQYHSYIFSYPIKALALYVKRYGDDELLPATVGNGDSLI